MADPSSVTASEPDHKTPIDCPSGDCRATVIHQHPPLLQFYNPRAEHATWHLGYANRTESGLEAEWNQQGEERSEDEVEAQGEGNDDDVDDQDVVSPREEEDEIDDEIGAVDDEVEVGGETGDDDVDENIMGLGPEGDGTDDQVGAVDEDEAEGEEGADEGEEQDPPVAENPSATTLEAALGNSHVSPQAQDDDEFPYDEYLRVMESPDPPNAENPSAPPIETAIADQHVSPQPQDENDDFPYSEYIHDVENMTDLADVLAYTNQPIPPDVMADTEPQRPSTPPAQIDPETPDCPGAPREEIHREQEGETSPSPKRESEEFMEENWGIRVNPMTSDEEPINAADEEEQGDSQDNAGPHPGLIQDQDLETHSEQSIPSDFERFEDEEFDPDAHPFYLLDRVREQMNNEFQEFVRRDNGGEP